MKAALKYFGITTVPTLEKVTEIYRKRVIKVHPDKNLNNPRAGEEFLELQENYQVLVEFFAQEQRPPQVVIPYTEEVINLTLRDVFCGLQKDILLLKNERCHCERPFRLIPCETCHREGHVWRKFNNAETVANPCPTCNGQCKERIPLCEDCGGRGYNTKQIKYTFGATKKLYNNKRVVLNDVRVNLLVHLEPFGDFSLRGTHDILYRSIVVTQEQASRPYQFELVHLDGRTLILCTTEVIHTDDLFVVPNEGLSPNGRLLIHFFVKELTFEIRKLQGITYISRNVTNRSVNGCPQQ